MNVDINDTKGKCWSCYYGHQAHGAGIVSLVETDGAAVCAAGIRRGGIIPNLAVGRMVPGAIFLNSNMLPNRTCWITGNLASNCQKYAKIINYSFEMLKLFFEIENITSFWYFLTRPELIFTHESTLLMLHSWFECSAKLPVLTFKWEL